METYAQKIGDVAFTTCAGLTLSLSKDTGILQALIEAQQPLTSQEIADRKKLKERYVQEILNCLATAEIVHLATNEAGTLVYHLEDGEKLVWNTSLMALVSFPVTIKSNYDQIKECVKATGPHGLRFADPVKDFLDEWSIYTTPIFVEKLTTLVGGLKEKLESGIDVIEFGCGRGRLLARFAEMFPQSNFTASEVTIEHLEKMKANLGHIPNIRFELYDLCSLPTTPVKKYDWVFCVNVIHDVPHPQEAFNGIRRFTKDQGGLFTMVDMATSGSPIADKGNNFFRFLYSAGTFTCIPESFQRKDSEAFGPTWAKQTVITMATAAGFHVQAIDIDYPESLFICTPQM